MPSVPLFTKAELEAAFALILPPKAAAETAEEWWDSFADQIDAQGRWLLKDHLVSRPNQPPDGLVVAGRRQTPAEVEAHERLLWSGMTIADRKGLLLRFSNFHMRLAGLVSDELFERMRVAEGISLEVAERGRSQMRRIIAAIQAGQR